VSLYDFLKFKRTRHFTAVALQTGAGEPFYEGVPKLSINFEEKIFRVPIKNFEENTKDWRPPKLLLIIPLLLILLMYITIIPGYS